MPSPTFPVPQPAGSAHAAYEIEGATRAGPWVVTCDHATNHVPQDVAGGDLGLSPGEMQRHIAYDIGAAGVTRQIAEALDGPAILSRFSRLVIDPNRGADDPTLVMRLYDGTIIPGNRHIGPAEIARRKARYYDPYHAALADLVGRRPDTALLAVHSFTPRLNGRHPRPWQLGLLYAGDARLARALQAEIAAAPDFAEWMAATSGRPLCLGDNQPYSGHLPGDSVDRHALRHGRPNLLIELRHDLIATAPEQARWAAVLAPLLQRALARLAA